MISQTGTLETLIQAAYAGAVFGPHEAFPQDAASKLELIRTQINEISLIFAGELHACIKTAAPELSEEEVQQILKEIGPKAVAFCPALTAGELPGDVNTRHLGAAASAIGTMYFADQSMDRGDELMVAAVEALGSKYTQDPSKPVLARVEALGHIQSNIERLALPEDAPIVLDCFNQQVLHNEALLHNFSLEYMRLDETAKQSFLATHARKITELMVTDAGFPSVTTALYAIYRQNDPNLPPLATVHNDPIISKLLQMCNVVVRIADEIGDWEIDAGNHPQWGMFSINPLNQYHPGSITRFCELASIQDETLRRELQQLFREFHADPKQYGARISTIFFTHARDYIHALPLETQTTYSLYLTLCKRVLEIGHVNMLGDKALAAA